MTSSTSSLSQATGKKQAVMQKVALVVDDSKLARYVLKEMLLEQGIKVETAESAEEALGTLSAFKPDVIFMDHMMPGMDGFQAVQAIKSDPSTAKIPIMMYTSKDEGVYINQARALGAVGVLPKKLKPVQLQKVLQQLKLIPQKMTQAAETSPPENNRVAENQAHIIANTQHSLDELARSASEDFEKDSMRQLFRQLFVEQRDTIKQDQHSLLQEMVSQVTPAISELSDRNVRWQKRILIVVLVMITMFIVIDFSDNQQAILVSMQKTLDAQSQSLHALKNTVNKASLVQIDSFESIPHVDTQALEWALNQNNQLVYQESLNTQKNQNYVIDLISHLNEQGYQGSLVIKFHEGDFCERNTAGVLSLLENKNSVMQCHPKAEYVTGQSRAFQDFDGFVRALDEQYDSINIASIEMGTQYTLEDYPVPALEVSSEEWNRVASKNRRLEYELTP
jgi:CheY-like chemotaxis protein